MKDRTEGTGTAAIPLDQWMCLETRARHSIVDAVMPHDDYFVHAPSAANMDVGAIGCCLGRFYAQREPERVTRGEYDPTDDPACKRVLARCGLTRDDVRRLAGGYHCAHNEDELIGENRLLQSCGLTRADVIRLTQADRPPAGTPTETPSAPKGRETFRERLKREVAKAVIAELRDLGIEVRP